MITPTCFHRCQNVAVWLKAFLFSDLTKTWSCCLGFQALKSDVKRYFFKNATAWREKNLKADRFDGIQKTYLTIFQMNFMVRFTEINDILQLFHLK